MGIEAAVASVRSRAALGSVHLRVPMTCLNAMTTQPEMSEIEFPGDLEMLKEGAESDAE